MLNDHYQNLLKCRGGNFMSINNIQYQLRSALFHVVDNLIITRDGVSFKVNKIFPNENGMENVHNVSRLRSFLFSEISKKYNSRINAYGLSVYKLPSSYIKKFNLYEYSSSRDNSSFSAYCNVFPRTFVCKKCGHFVAFKNGNDSEFDNFDVEKCQLGCGGSYEQIFNMKFCEACGNLEPIQHFCKKHGKNATWKLIRPDRFQPITWKLSCEQCRIENPNYEPLDILRYPCNPKYRSNRDSSRFTLLMATEGSIYQPIVLTMVDIPDSTIDFFDLDYIIFGLYLHRFDDFFNEVNIESNGDYGYLILKIKEYLDISNNELAMNAIPEKMKKDILKLNDLIDLLKTEFDDYSFVNINDYLVLSGTLSKNLIDSISFDEFIDDDVQLKSKFASFKKEYKIDQIRYLSNINLVSAVIGVDIGFNKFYDENFIPHFEPLWETYEKKAIKSYVCPFETEGIMINLDKCEVVNWLIDNKYIEKDYVTNDEEASTLLMSLQVGDKEYDLVKKLIHTLSHILIRRSSLYTGLDEDSCSEMLFVNSASILIYSSSSINIGGFSFIFENALMEWFDGIKLEIDDCVLDPSCIDESGACFSCLYLPEYVCSEFNSDLDRDILIGKTSRFKKGFW